MDPYTRLQSFLLYLAAFIFINGSTAPYYRTSLCIAVMHRLTQMAGDHGIKSQAFLPHSPSKTASAKTCKLEAASTILVDDRRIEGEKKPASWRGNETSSALTSQEAMISLYVDLLFSDKVSSLGQQKRRLAGPPADPGMRRITYPNRSGGVG